MTTRDVWGGGFHAERYCTANAGSRYEAILIRYTPRRRQKRLTVTASNYSAHHDHDAAVEVILHVVADDGQGDLRRTRRP